jgi:transposase
MAIFNRELVRPTYSCRSCEQQVHDPQITNAVLPPEPVPKSGIGAGLLAHVIVSNIVDHLPLRRQESILTRHV